MSTRDLFLRSLNASFLVAGLTALVGTALAPSASAEPFKLGADQKVELENNNYPAYPQYPTPQAYPTPQRRAPINGNAQNNQLNGSAQSNQAPPPVRRPIPVQIQKQVVLPANFLGAWNVQGQRMKVEAMPEFQAGAEAVFAPNTSNVWNIGGNPSSGYSMSSDAGVQTSLVVDKVEGNTAFIRYSHPIKNTVAQEAIVMSLVPGGAVFNGLERVSIAKEGVTRAKVTYQLVGRRNR
ncbi:MAG: hypothetical protein IAF58_08170 [Leptolyngbya sp.]|nr:hypothetical protein [Candidatus Melainabacteria bacterium]